ncbi:MAG: alanine racemase [Pseudohongiellaceae bacterium]|jgi:alanine racemase
MARPAKAEIDLDALRYNYRVAKNAAPNSQAIAVVKANAYGHGAVAVAKALAHDAPAFAVACIEEAIELRVAGITTPILLLEGAFTADEIIVADEQNFWLAVGSQYQVDAVIQAHVKNALKVWLKVDTGMHRLGVQPDQAPAIYRQLAESDNVQEGIVIMSHLACAYELDRPETPKQIECYTHTIKTIEVIAQALGEAIETSMGNSAGTLAWADCISSWNRPGYMLYGGSPFPHSQKNADQLKPVMSLRTGVIDVRYIEPGECVGYGAMWCAERVSKIATIAMGYADGYPRGIKPGTPVLIHGVRVPIVGSVSMDMITIDVTDVAHVNIGDEVTLWGDGLPIDEVAGYAGTIGYELVARMPLRVPRIYNSE